MWLENRFTAAGLSQKEASAYVVIILIMLAQLLTGLGWFDTIGRFAGAGVIVPITGFANSMVAPALEYKKEGLVLGVGASFFLWPARARYGNNSVCNNRNSIQVYRSLGGVR